ncbi:Nucleoporin nup84 [Puccinia graminis f. sp. tritici]|uniref:Nuclear pore complex protein n=1 Tax=Puccinia graminis f. sp. tritici TaxID=56615 RepID=A0A5B0N5B4_PUCGR|nr:Nucleoporin nup84 [Puccinia graminis f. sp. tritici]KAA1123337.1 Nucleoporin nup84 [Puccinia graminis f. sp. tritici]
MSLIHQTQPLNFASEDHHDEFSLFADALKTLRVDEIDPLDPEHGPAAVWKRICDSKLDNRNIHLSPEQKESWNLERNTWQLVQMLYTERTAPPQSSSSKLTSNPYLPPLKVVNLHLSKSKDLLELSTFRDWLYTCPSSTHPAEIRRGYWPYTKASLKHTLQKYPHSDSRRPSGKAPPFHAMDPDAPLRASRQQTNQRSQTLQSDDNLNFVSDPNAIQEKGELEQLDQEYDRAMVKTLYEYIRAGEMGLALDLCRQCDHPWRAASLAGGQLFQDPSLEEFEDESPLPQDEVLPDAESLDNPLNETRNLPPYKRSGCLNRKLWKSMCLHMSSNKSLPTYEQALYGALAGETSSVLPVCYTWEDHIWCHINAIFENQVDQILESNQLGYYWSHGALPPAENHQIDASDDDTIISSLQPQHVARQNFPQRSNGEPQTDIKLAMNKAFDKILRSEQTSLAESARNPFHVAQMWLAIDKINDLFTSFSDRLKSASEDFTREHLSHLLRFFSHLILFLRAIDEKVDSEASNAILRGYVQVLEMENKHNLIAFYVAELQPESGVETYAKYLISLGPSADFPTRRVALLRALEHGLDLSRVACTAVKLTLQEITRASLESNREHGLNKFSHQLTDKQRELIRSLEWLIIDPATYLEALIQANSLIRYFLTAGHPNAAREVVCSVPADVLSVIAQGKDPLAEPEAGDITGNTHNAILEFTQYRDFFNCLELHVQVDEILSQRPMDGSTTSELQAFTQALEEMCDHLYTAVTAILSSEWLQDIRFNPTENMDEQEQAADRRVAELNLIRNIYIPELVFRLHGALVESGDYIVTNLRRALDLATLVANESYKNYVEFMPLNQQELSTPAIHKKKENKMKDYLRELRGVHLRILKCSGVHPLRAVLK